MIKDDLLNCEISHPLLAIYKVTTLIENKHLVGFFKKLLTLSKDIDEYLLMLLKLKRLVIQNPREPDPEIQKEFGYELCLYFEEIEKEQELFEPIKWLDAEINYLLSLKRRNSDKQKEKLTFKDIHWHTAEEVRRFLEISTSTLNRYIAGGFPVYNLGGRSMFNTQEMNDYLLKQKATMSY